MVSVRRAHGEVDWRVSAARVRKIKRQRITGAEGKAGDCDSQLMGILCYREVYSPGIDTEGEVGELAGCFGEVWWKEGRRGQWKRCGRVLYSGGRGERDRVQLICRSGTP